MNEEKGPSSASQEGLGALLNDNDRTGPSPRDRRSGPTNVLQTHLKHSLPAAVFLPAMLLILNVSPKPAVLKARYQAAMIKVGTAAAGCWPQALERKLDDLHGGDGKLLIGRP